MMIGDYLFMAGLTLIYVSKRDSGGYRLFRNLKIGSSFCMNACHSNKTDVIKHVGIGPACYMKYSQTYVIFEGQPADTAAFILISGYVNI